jgi:hypothetical protein
VIKVRLSHLFHDAPAPVIEAVAHILFAKLYRHRTPRAALDRYHHYVEANQSRFREAWGVEARLKTLIHRPRGRHHDLEKSFERVNQRYFHPCLQKPMLAWTTRNGHSKLGEYQSLRNAIIINRHFDRADTPPFVIDYLIFHEMLHMKHRAEIRSGRRVVHTRSFRKEEAAFEKFTAAKEWIRSVTHLRDWRDSPGAY